MTARLKFIAILLIMAGSFATCVDPVPELPAETQIGANTFGCLVNGELVVPYKPYYEKPRAVYYQVTDSLRIIGYGQNNQVFKLTMKQPKANLPATIDKVVYYPPNSPPGNFYYGGNNIGEITLTQFDLSKRVVSGIFHFVGHKRNAVTGELIVPDEAVTVSLGRFDITITNY